MSYISFERLLERFQGQIYHTRKGRLRMQLIDALYRQYLPPAALADQLVLDVGGGLGQMSHWLLENGALVHYLDASEKMVQATTTSLGAFIEAGRLNVHHGAIADYQPVKPYAVVNAHAVLAWQQDPIGCLQQIMPWVAPGGYLGLMVYNKHMLMLRHLLRGTLKRAMVGDLRGRDGGLTPLSPLEPDQVALQLQQAGFKVLCRAGVRSFSDLAEQTVIDWYAEEEVFAAELALCQQPPYRDLARYVLFIAKR